MHDYRMEPGLRVFGRCRIFALAASIAMAAPAAAQTKDVVEPKTPALSRDGAFGRALVLKNKNTSADRAGRELKQAGASAADAIAGLHKAGYSNADLAE